MGEARDRTAEAPLVEENVLASFDPLLDSAAAPAPAPCSAGLGMPKEIAEAFKAASEATNSPPQSDEKEWLPSGLSVDGQALLMKQIGESATKMRGWLQAH